MKRLGLYSQDCCIAFATDCQPALDFLHGASMTALVPGYTCSEKVRHALATIQYFDRSEATLVYRGKRTAVLTGTWEDIVDSTGLGRFISIHFEPLYQQQALYPLHACVVEYNGNAVALLGERNAGKTTTGLTLCLRHGLRFVFNSRVLLKYNAPGRFVVEDGVKVITVRADMARFVPELAERVPATALSWSRHSIGDTSAIHIPKSEVLPVPLQALILMRLNPAVQQARVLCRDEAVAELYDRSSLMIRMGAVMLQGQTVIPSLDTPLLATQRLAFVRDVAAHVPFMQMTGSMEFICQEICALLKA